MDLCLIAASEFSWLSLESWGNMGKMALGLGVVIFVHELGHFLVAKACGVKCEKFYLGFDVPFGRFINYLLGKEGEFKVFGIGIPKTLGLPVKWGETQYGIGIVPLGGYVKMLGQDDNPANAEKEAERTRIPQVVDNDAADRDAVSPTGNHVHHKSVTDVNLEPQPLAEQLPYQVDPRSYTAKSVPQRMAIISAGVIMNVIFAVVFATIAYRIGVPYTPSVIGGTVPGGPAWEIDLPRGAQVLRVGEKGPKQEELRFQQDMSQEIMMSGAEKDVSLLIRTREGSERTVSIRPVEKDPGMLFPKMAFIGVRPDVEPILSAKDPLLPNFAASKAKVQLGPNDRIIAALVDGEETPIKFYSDLNAFLARNVDRTVTLRAERNSKGTDGKETKEIIESTIDPQPLRHLGLAMTMGPVTAIQVNSPALAAAPIDDPSGEKGFRKGDVLVAVDGDPLGDPLLAPDLFRLAGEQGREVVVTVDRKSADGELQQVKLRVTPRPVSEYQSASVYLDDPVLVDALGLTYGVIPTVTAVDSRSAAADVIQPGDKVVKLQFAPSGKTAQEQKKNAALLAQQGFPDKEFDLSAERFSWPSMFFMMQSLPDFGQVKVTYLRDGKEQKLELAPFADDKHHFGVRGMSLQAIEGIHQVDSWSEAFPLGLRATKENLLLVVRFLKKLVNREISPFALGGLPTIAVAGTAEASQGWGALLMFLTMLSANLAVVNFLPIPMLDGGHMVFLTYEGIRRRPLPEAWQMRFQLLGLAFLLCLMAFVLGLDIFRFSGLAQ